MEAGVGESREDTAAIGHAGRRGCEVHDRQPAVMVADASGWNVFEGLERAVGRARRNGPELATGK